MTVVYMERNVPYLPLPNTIEVVLTRDLAPVDKTATAFVVPVFENGDILLACNKTRGIEIAGGHIEPGEDMEQAACREAIEEVGCIVSDLVPIGYLRMTSQGAAPDGYSYAHPVSYQQFFAGTAGEIVPCGDYECDLPVRTSALDGFKRPSVNIFVAQARSISKRRMIKT